MKRRAMYAGSFNPPTNGHMWVVEEGAHLKNVEVRVTRMLAERPAQ